MPNGSSKFKIKTLKRWQHQSLVLVLAKLSSGPPFSHCGHHSLMSPKLSHSFYKQTMLVTSIDLLKLLLRTSLSYLLGLHFKLGNNNRKWAIKMANPD